jgi:hypothetical protein
VDNVSAMQARLRAHTQTLAALRETLRRLNRTASALPRVDGRRVLAGAAAGEHAVRE